MPNSEPSGSAAVEAPSPLGIDAESRADLSSPIVEAALPADADPELGVLAKVIAIPLTPFVAIWEGARAVVTGAIPAMVRRYTALLRRVGLAFGNVLRRLGRLVIAPSRALIRVVAAAARRVIAVVVSVARQARELARGAVRSVATPVVHLLRLVARQVQALARFGADRFRVVGRAAAGLLRRLFVAARGRIGRSIASVLGSARDVDSAAGARRTPSREA